MLLLPELVQWAVVCAVGGLDWPSLLVTVAQTAGFSLAATALLLAVNRRLWDVLALQWGLLVLLTTLTSHWIILHGVKVPEWMEIIWVLVIWLSPVLVSVVYLRKQNRKAMAA